MAGFPDPGGDHHRVKDSREGSRNQGEPGRCKSNVSRLASSGVTLCISCSQHCRVPSLLCNTATICPQSSHLKTSLFSVMVPSFSVCAWLPQLRSPDPQRIGALTRLRATTGLAGSLKPAQVGSGAVEADAIRFVANRVVDSKGLRQRMKVWSNSAQPNRIRRQCEGKGFWRRR